MALPLAPRRRRRVIVVWVIAIARVRTRCRINCVLVVVVVVVVPKCDAQFKLQCRCEDNECAECAECATTNNNIVTLRWQTCQTLHAVDARARVRAVSNVIGHIITRGRARSTRRSICYQIHFNHHPLPQLRCVAKVSLSKRRSRCIVLLCYKLAALHAIIVIPCARALSSYLLKYLCACSMAS